VNDSGISVPGAATDLQLSPDGRLLGVAWSAGLRVYRTDGGAETAIEADAPVAAVAFSPDGSQVALGCEDGSVRVADAATGAEAVRGESEHGGLVSLSWSPDGELLAAGHFEPWVAVFGAATGERMLLLDPDIFDDEGRTSTVFLDDGRLLSTALDNLVIWRLPADPRVGKRPRRRRLPAGGEVHMVDLDATGDRAMGLSDLEGRACIHVWDLAEPRKPASSVVPGRCRRVRWLPDGATAAVAHAEGVTAWSVDAGCPAELGFEGVGDEGVCCLAVATEPAVLYGGTEGGVVLAWDAVSGRRV
jgi:WD40 repeat protein